MNPGCRQKKIRSYRQHCKENNAYRYTSTPDNQQVYRLFLSKYAIDPEIENNFDSYEDLDYDLGMDLNADSHTIEMDELDGNF